MTDYFPQITKWIAPSDLLQIAVSEMAIDGKLGREGTCLWLGTKNGEVAEIKTTVILRGALINKSPANITIAPELIREVHHASRNDDLLLIGQIHSHGRSFGLGLSPIDRAGGFKVPSFLTIVAPDYGLTWPITWEDCGVHVYLKERGFVRLSKEQVREKIIVSESRSSVITIGDGE